MVRKLNVSRRIVVKPRALGFQRVHRCACRSVSRVRGCPNRAAAICGDPCRVNTLAPGAPSVRGLRAREAVHAPRRQQSGLAGVTPDIPERLDLGHQSADTLVSFSPAPEQVLAVKRRHADTRFHPSSSCAVFRDDGTPNSRYSTLPAAAPISRRGRGCKTERVPRGGPT